MKYMCVKETLTDENMKEYYTYSIKSEDGEICIHDVSLDGLFVKNIVFALNKYEASPIHINDIIEDMLN